MSKKPLPAAVKTQANRPKSKRRKSRRGNSNLGVYIIAGLLITLAGLIIYRIVDQAIARNQAEQPIAGVQSFPNQVAGHQEGPLTYSQTPPVGGVHNPAWQNCGVYTTPIANENGVHTLEHGAVWITYAPDLPAGELQQLQALIRQGGDGYRLLSPYAGLSSPIVASAWGYQLQLQSASDPALSQFIEAYELNPNSPEPGAPCTNGVGTPQ